MMLKRTGKRGEFLSCSGYPECKTTMNFDAQGQPVVASKPTEHVTRTLAALKALKAPD